MATYYFWDEIEDNVVREYDDNNSTIAEYTAEPTLYGSVLSQERARETRYFQFDGQGNTTELTDPNGTVTDTRRYSAFGETTVSSGTTSTPFGFGGRWGYHSSGGAPVSIRRRQYEVRAANWLSPDPLGISALRGASVYRFVWNCPPSHVDPSGLYGRPSQRFFAGSQTLHAISVPLGSETVALTECSTDPCADCNRIVKDWPQDEFIIRISAQGQPAKKCIARIECNQQCPNDLIGATTPPIQTGAGQYLIAICISCKVIADDIAKVIRHELTHFKRFCRAGHGIQTCSQCRAQEEAAYKESCKDVAKEGTDDYKQCVECGVYLGCRGLKSDSGKGACINSPSKPCDYGTIGIHLK